MIYIRGIITDIKYDKNYYYPKKYILKVVREKETLEMSGKGECPFILNEVITVRVSHTVLNNKIYYNIEESVSPEFIMESDKKYNIVNPGIYSVQDWRLFQHSSNQALQVMVNNKNSTLTNMEATYINLTKDFLKWNQELLK